MKSRARKREIEKESGIQNVIIRPIQLYYKLNIYLDLKSIGIISRRVDIVQQHTENSKSRDIDENAH